LLQNVCLKKEILNLKEENVCLRKEILNLKDKIRNHEIRLILFEMGEVTSILKKKICDQLVEKEQVD
jgi:2-hydroxy-3-keto-5-methylthiopentenyl-1-phosphate phosphatase